jgi:arginase
MRSISLIELPYDSGRFNERMGRGPRAVLDAGLADYLQTRDFRVEVTPVRLPDGFYTDEQALVELQRLAVPSITEALDSSARPIVLSGNCATAALSAVCALGARETAVIWFDAHGDFNTPETSASGFLDGMALAILTGRCWPKLAERLQNFHAVPEKHVVQIGVRSPDLPEEMNFQKSAINRIGPKELWKLKDALEKLRVRHFYLHLDVDVLDPSEGHANSFACSGGVSLEDLVDALKVIGRTSKIAAGSVTAYDPAADSDGRIGRAIPRLVELLAQ